MARPLRIEFPGALYDVTSRGNERRLIYRDIGNPNRFLDILAECSERHHWHARSCSDRKQAMALAYRSGHYTLKQIGDYFGVSRMTVSRAAKNDVKSEN